MKLYCLQTIDNGGDYLIIVDVEDFPPESEPKARQDVYNQVMEAIFTKDKMNEYRDSLTIIPGDANGLEQFTLDELLKEAAKAEDEDE